MGQAEPSDQGVEVEAKEEGKVVQLEAKELGQMGQRLQVEAKNQPVQVETKEQVVLEVVE